VVDLTVELGWNKIDCSKSALLFVFGEKLTLFCPYRLLARLLPRLQVWATHKLLGPSFKRFQRYSDRAGRRPSFLLLPLKINSQLSLLTGFRARINRKRYSVSPFHFLTIPRGF